LKRNTPIVRHSPLKATGKLPLSSGGTSRVSGANGQYPQIGSVWWGEYLDIADPSEADQVQLFLGPNFTSTAAASIQSAAPLTPILNSVNAIETANGVPAVPSSYYLQDTNGNPICDWPGNYLLNLTNPTVVQFLAQYAAQQLTQGGITYNGIFFDNIETSISNKTTDCEGNPIQISAAGDGVATNPVTLDQEWSAGLYNLISTFKQLAPNAYASGHISQLPSDPRSLAVFDGDLMGFDAVDVREGSMAFGNLWDTYQQWFAQGQQPELTGIQSSPPNQIAYGYGYTPFQQVLPSTAAFGQSFYPNMRFGLAFTLMNNGYSIFDFGDTTSPVAWWYDEYNFNLGSPVTPATLLGSPSGENQLENGGFAGSVSPWIFSAAGGGAGTLALDTSNFASGSTSSAHVTVTAPAPNNWQIDLEQDNLSVTSGVEYKVQFWAKADSDIQITVGVQGGAPSYANYGMSTQLELTTGWNYYSLSFLSNATASDGRLEFWLGNSVANIWFDSVQFTQAPTRIYRRDFTNGVVLLNGTQNPQTISLESGIGRFTGTQAPLYQYIVDDADPGFTSTGTWTIDTFDTGFRKATGPYYHAWKSTLHENDDSSGVARWNLNLPADGQYTIQVWLPAAPSSSAWTQNAVYQVMSGSQVLASTTLNQSTASGGDQWYTIANVNLTAAGAPFVRLTNGGSGPLIADAVYVYSTTALYNSGAAVSQVTIAPMDGILLQRATPNQSIAFSSPGDQTLGEAPFNLTATATSGLPVTFASNSLWTCTVSGNTVTLLALGTCSITATQPGNSSWTAAVPVTQTFYVLAFQTISFAPLNSQILGVDPIALSAAASSGLPVSFTSNTASVCTVSGSNVTAISVGVCSVTASQAGGAGYSPAAAVTDSFSVFAPQSITFSAPAEQALGELPVALSATASSGLPVAFISNSPAICSVTGSSASMLSPGLCSITASQAGDTTYAPAPSVTQTFIVAINLLTNGGFEGSLDPWQLVVIADGQASATAVLDSTTAVDGSSSADITVQSAGTETWHVEFLQPNLPLYANTTYQVQFWAKSDISAWPIDVALQVANPRYPSNGPTTTVTLNSTWTLYSMSFIAPSTSTYGQLQFRLGNMPGNVWLDDVQLFGAASTPQIITFPQPASQAITSSPVALVATVDSGLPVTFLSDTLSTCTVAGNIVNLLALGTCTITASQPGNAAYNAATPVTQSFMIVSSPQTITFPAPPTQALGTAPFALSATATSGLAVSFASTTLGVCSVSGNTVTLITGGTCIITASQPGNADFAAAAPVSQGFAVTPYGQTITFTSLGTQALGGAPFQAAASASSGLPVTVSSSTAAVCTATSNTVTLLAIGTCTLTANQPGSTSFSAAVPVTQSFLVTSNEIINGNFASGSLAPWVLQTNADGQVSGSVALDSTTAAPASTASADVTIAAVGTADWHLDFEQPNLALVAGATYQVQFWANTDSARTIEVAMQGGAPNFSYYGLDSLVNIGTGWQLYSLSFIASTTATDGQLEFYLAANTGNVWLDDVQLYSTAGATQTISFTALANQTFGAAPFAISATASSGLPVAFTTATSSVCAVSGSTVTLLAAGTCSITASQAGSATYAAAMPVMQSFTVSQEQQTIAFASIASEPLGTAPFAISATASSGLAVSFTSGTPSVCSVSGSTVTLVAQGTCSITASQAGNTNFSAASPATQSFTVTAGQQTIAFGAIASQVFGTSPFTLTATASSGLAVTFASNTPAVCAVSGSTVSLLAVGTCSVTASQGGNSSVGPATPVTQTFAITQAPQSITFGSIASQAYGTSPSALSATASSGLAVSFASNTPSVCTVSGSTVTLVAAGTCSITASQAGNSNYAAASSVTQSFTVTKEQQTITFGTISSKAYGSSPFALGATASSGLAASYATTTSSVCTVSGSTVTLVAAGTCSITASQAGNSNYAAASSITQSFAVTQEQQTITFGTITSHALGTSPFTISATANSGLAVSFTSTTSSACTITGSTVTLVASGTCSITAGQAGNADFAAAAPVTQSFTVTASHSVSLGWNAPSGSSDPVVGYDIYRTPSGGTTYTLLNSSAVSGTSYVDTTVASGSTYDYMVKSVDSSGTQSVPSNIVGVTIP
jgi:hypothetical protein